jgi:hypothetical protein
MELAPLLVLIFLLFDLITNFHGNSIRNEKGLVKDKNRRAATYMVNKAGFLDYSRLA